MENNTPNFHLGNKLDKILNELTEHNKEQIIIEGGGGYNPFKNYTLVTDSEWNNLPKETYVKYINAEGETKSGGKIKSIKKDGFLLGKYVMNLKKYLNWTVKFKNI
jgi:hypothetical protein